MKSLSIGTNFAVFVLFFGVATLEAFETKNWVKAGFWLVIGIVFLVADNLKQKHASVKLVPPKFALSELD